MGIESGGKYDQDFRRLLEEEIAERKQTAEPEQQKVVLIGDTTGIREVIRRALEGKNIRVITAEAPDYAAYLRRMQQNALFDDHSMIIIPRQQPPRNTPSLLVIEKKQRMVESMVGGTTGDHDGNVWTMGHPPGSINYPVAGRLLNDIHVSNYALDHVVLREVGITLDSAGYLIKSHKPDPYTERVLEIEPVDPDKIDPKAILAVSRQKMTLEVKKFNNGRKGPKKHGDRY